jgi:hypothetical protein
VATWRTPAAGKNESEQPALQNLSDYLLPIIEISYDSRT